MTLSKSDIEISVYLNPTPHQKDYPPTSISIKGLIRSSFVLDGQYQNILLSPLFHAVNKTLKNHEFHFSHSEMLEKYT